MASRTFFLFANLLKKFQLNRFTDYFFRNFTLINTFRLPPEIINITILLICNTQYTNLSRFRQ